MLDSQVWVVALSAAGSLFLLISAIGMLRLPNVHDRMHAVGKAATLGVSCLLLSDGILFGEGQNLRMVALIILFFVTAPIATTAMARAAYRRDRPSPKSLKHDDLANPDYNHDQTNQHFSERQ